MKTNINQNNISQNKHNPNLNYYGTAPNEIKNGTKANILDKINLQFDQIYQENKKRKYILTEISNYIIKK